MALIAVGAVVDVAIHSRVIEVVSVIAAVTPRALKYRVVTRVDVASRAHTTRAPVVG